MVLIVCEKEDHYQKEHSKMVKRVVIVGIQMEPKINEKKRNIEKTAYFCEEAYGNGAKIVVFLECNLAGYCYSDYHEAMSVSEPVPGPSTEHLQGICKGLDLLMFVGLIERQGEGCYNSAVLIGSEGVVGT